MSCFCEQWKFPNYNNVEFENSLFSLIRVYIPESCKTTTKANKEDTSITQTYS